MNDEELDRELSEFLDGELAPHRAADLETRLASDPVLAARLAAFAAADEELRSLARPEMPAGSRARLHQRIDGGAENEGTVRSRPLAGAMRVAVATAATLAAAALAVEFWFPQSAIDPPPVEVASVVTEIVDDVSDDELAIAFDLETLRDLELIRELDLLEALLAMDDAEAQASADDERG